MGFLTGLQASASALKAEDLQMETIAHNVANANTEGYSRQVAHLVQNDPYLEPGIGTTGAGGYVGAGVRVNSISRSRDAFLDVQIRGQLGSTATQKVTSDMYATLDQILGEPSNGGLSTALSGFIGAMSGAASTPQSIAARQALLDAANTLTDKFHSLTSAINDQRRALNDGVKATVDLINADADQIASLNAKIGYAQAAGASPNDLMDQRDRVLDHIIGLTGGSYSIGDDGQATVSLGGKPLALQNLSFHLGVQLPGGGSPMWNVYYVPDNTPAILSGGTLGATVANRDVTLVGVQTQMDTLAAGLVAQYNTIHQRGFGMSDAPVLTWTPGGPPAFASVTLGANPGLSGGSWSISTTAAGAVSAVFTPLGGVAAPALNGSIAAGGTNSTLIPGLVLTAPAVLVNATDTVAIATPARNLFDPLFITASSIKLDGAVASNPKALALALNSNSPADGGNALVMTAQADAAGMSAGTATFSQFWQNQIGTLGSAAANNARLGNTSDAIVKQLDARRNAISSVSLDEEGVDLIRVQRAYQAAAQMITAQNAMIGSLLAAVGAR